jgi:hypothetical protein
MRRLGYATLLVVIGVLVSGWCLPVIAETALDAARTAFDEHMAK